MESQQERTIIFADSSFSLLKIECFFLHNVNCHSKEDDLLCKNVCSAFVLLGFSLILRTLDWGVIALKFILTRSSHSFIVFPLHFDDLKISKI